MNLLRHILCMSLMAFYLSSLAQVKTNFNSEVVLTNQGTFKKNYRAQVDFEIPTKNIDELKEKERRENENSKGEKPFRFAEASAVNLDIANQINWVTDSNYAYGKFTIKLKGALSASINFDDFYLPQGTEMYIYNQNGNMITGPITENENNLNKVWGSWVLKGEFLIIEVKTPISTKSTLLLHSNNIAYGYKEIYKVQTAGFGQSAPCEINVLCPLGTGWEAERSSVALVLNDNGIEWCSGAMIMNTCSTSRPFFLTANHCYATIPIQNVKAWRFTFQAWSPTCTPSQNNSGVTYNGSTLRANWSGTDFCLVELNNTPPINSGINYAGWSRNTTGITGTTILHHPSGDVMKIARDNNAPVFNNFQGAQCWQLVVDNGTTEGGSSGSPYFDQNHRIYAQHSGINDFNLPVCQQVNKFGGRFDVSWTGGGTSATRLRDWLDPSNSNTMVTNTASIADLFPTGSFTINGADYICNSETYSVNLPLTGVSVSWQILQAGSVVSSSTSGNSVTISKIKNGSIELDAIITNLCDNSTRVVKKTLIVGTGTTGKFWLHGQNFNYTATGPGNYYSVCPNESLWFEPYYGTSGNPATSHIWTISGSYTLLSGLNGSTLSVIAPPNVQDAFSISYQYYSVCGGWSDIAYGGAGVMNCAGGEEPYRIQHKTPEKELAINTKPGVHPNPARTTLIVDVAFDHPKGQIALVDMNGKQVYQANITGKRNIINVSSFSSGVYLLRLTINGKTETTKVVISK